MHTTMSIKAHNPGQHGVVKHNRVPLLVGPFGKVPIMSLPFIEAIVPVVDCS
jgi:hypothetical protein